MGNQRTRRIILTVTNDLTYDQRMHKICNTLNRSGYAVELVGRTLPSSVPLDSKPFKQTRLSCFFHKGKLFYIEYNLRLFLYLLCRKFDAVGAVDLDTITAAVIAAKLKGKKVVFDAHEHFTEVPEVIRRPAVQKVWRWVEKIFVPKADAHYTVSPGLARIFNEATGKHFDVVLNVPSLQTNTMESSTKEKYILYQGALNEGRGLEHLLVAMKQINIPLYIAGEGDLSDQLRQQAKDLGIEHKVKFLGYVKPDALTAITRNAWVGLHISEPIGLSYYYSLGNKFFDYIHAHLPQICTTMPEYERINNTYEVAAMINTSSPAEINRAIQHLLADPDYYNRLKKNCEVCAQYFNWQTEEKKLQTIYEQLFR